MAKFLDSAGLTYLWGKIQQSINEQIAVNLRLEVVEALPVSGEGNIIYLVPGQTTATSNIYDEYIWTGTPGAWEKIGTTATDLANYYTKNQIDSKLGTLASGYDDFASWITAINTSLGNLSTIVGNGSGISGTDLTASIVALESLVGSFTGDGTHTTIGSAVDYLLDEIDGESGIKSDIGTINATIGDVNSGLVKDVDDLQVSVSTLESAMDDLQPAVGDLLTTVGDSNSGLVADVATNTSDISNLQTVVGDANSGLVKDVADNASSISTLNTAVGSSSDTASASGSLYARIAQNAADIAAIGALTNTEIDTAIDNYDPSGD